MYELDDDGRPKEFHITKAPTHKELGQVLDTIIKRTTRYLEKRGIISRDEDRLQIDLSEDDALTRLQAGAATYRFALGPNKGKKALTLKTVPDTDHVATKGLVAKNSGISLHAGVAMTGTERDKIEKLCRYIARPAVAVERLSLNQRGQVVYTLKKPYDDGTTHIVMTPLELMERLAAIVPRPRVHLTRFAGVFAPHYKYRALRCAKAQGGGRARGQRQASIQLPHLLGEASQTRVWHRRRDLPFMFRKNEDHSRDRRAGSDQKDPIPSRPANQTAGTMAGQGATGPGSVRAPAALRPPVNSEATTAPRKGPVTTENP